jgi:hypothetical protein
MARYDRKIEGGGLDSNKQGQPGILRRSGKSGGQATAPEAATSNAEQAVLAGTRALTLGKPAL